MTRVDPAHLVGFVRNWPAFGKWSPEWFAQRFGEVEVEVMGDLVRHPDYPLEPEHNRRTMSLGAFAAAVEREPGSAETYLVAQNRALLRPELFELHDDLVFDPDWFDPADPSDPSDRVSLWMGPRGTVTPLHHDLESLLLAQLYGDKRVTLVSPAETSRLYSDGGGYSRVDVESPDLRRFPAFAAVPTTEVHLRAGDALFLPAGWWHHVRALSPSISLSLSGCLTRSR